LSPHSGTALNSLSCKTKKIKWHNKELINSNPKMSEFEAIFFSLKHIVKPDLYSKFPPCFFLYKENSYNSCREQSYA